MIPWLDSPVEFPPINKALQEPNGLLAAGGDLSAETLLTAYHHGIFPWYQSPDPILWWAPNPRFVVFPERVHISSSMKKLLRKNPWQIRCDTAFSAVMRACAMPRDYTDDTWINEELIAGYTALHRKGYAHSVEVWQEDKLIGGLYGVALGRVFFGESMFSLLSNSSKYAFIHLAHTLNRAGFALIDCQVASNHLHSLGAENISGEKFQQLLQQNTQLAPLFSPWDVLNDEPRFTNL